MHGMLIERTYLNAWGRIANPNNRKLRERYAELCRDMGYVNDVLADGAKRARAVASEVMDDVRRATGLLTIHNA